MASSSHPKSASRNSTPTPSQSSDEMDDLMKDVDSNRPDFKETVKRSLTNLNIHIASVDEQVEELSKSYQQFSINFIKQQEVLVQELKMLRIDSAHIRKLIADFVDGSD